MALDTFIAGRYTGTYNSSDLGIQEEGYRERFSARVQEIGDTDAYGEALIDAIYRLGRYRLTVDSLTYKSGTIAAIWPFGSIGTGGVVGRLLSGIAAAAVLSATSGTPAAAAPASLTAALSILAPGFEVNLLYSSRVRKVQVDLEVLYGGTTWTVRT